MLGWRQEPSVPTIDLGGTAARCLSQGAALELATVKHLLEQGLAWGERLAALTDGYLVLGECVVGGTTTALAILTGLGITTRGISSSHPISNHEQKRALVKTGLLSLSPLHCLDLVAAVGDPMQIATAGMAIAASRTCGVMLAGGTQMLAVYALIRAVANDCALPWQPEQIIVGTTRWVGRRFKQLYC